MAQAASAAAAGSVPDSCRICAAASSAARAACSQIAFRSRCGERAGAGARPALAELGPGQIGGELAAAVPHRAAVFGRVAGQGDRVAGDLAGVLRAVPRADQHPGAAEKREELLLAARPGSGGGDMAAQRDPRGFIQATAGGFAGLGPGGAPGRGPVGGRGGLQPVAFLGGQARIPHLAPFVGQADPAAVLPGQHRHDMDVIIAVPDRDPPDGVVFLPVGAQPGAVHHVAGNLRPLLVGQHLVPPGGAHRQVPHRAAEPVHAHRRVRLLEQAGQFPEIPRAIGAKRRLQLGRMAPARDDMRIGVLFVTAWAVQVVNEPGDVLAARLVDHPDHRAALRDAVRAARMRPGTRTAVRSVIHRSWMMVRARRIAVRASRTAIRTRGPPDDDAADHPRQPERHPGLTGASSAAAPRRHPDAPRGACTPGRTGPARRGAARSR